MKYIKTKINEFIIFSETMTHKEMAQNIGKKIKSAGFTDGRKFYGKSVSLSLGSDPKDSEIFMSQILGVGGVATTIENIAKEMDMPVDEYYDYIVDSYINGNNKESFKMFQEVCDLGGYKDFKDNLGNYGPETREAFTNFLMHKTYDK